MGYRELISARHGHAGTIPLISLSPLMLLDHVYDGGLISRISILLNFFRLFKPRLGRILARLVYTKAMKPCVFKTNQFNRF